MRVSVILTVYLALLVYGSRPSEASTPNITSVVDLNAHEGWHKIRITGTFPALNAPPCPEQPWLFHTSNCYAVEVICNGAWHPAVITSNNGTVIEAKFAERPSASLHAPPGSGPRCSVIVKNVHGQSDERGFFFGRISSPPIEIHSSIDLGGSNGQHTYRLKGYLPAGLTYFGGLTCNGINVNASLVYTAPDTLDVTFSDPPPASSCIFHIGRSDGASAPSWYERVNGNRPPLPSWLGAFYWGGFEADTLRRTSTPALAIQRLQEAGITGPIRMVLTPLMRAAPPPPASSSEITPLGDFYNLFTEGPVVTVPACAGLYTLGDNDFLPYAACSERFQGALNQIPNNSLVIITAHDSTTAGPRGGLYLQITESWMTGEGTPNFNAVKQEYYRFAKVLLTTQQNTGKTFVIANWEGDNTLFPPGTVQAFLVNGSTGDSNGEYWFPKRRNALINWFKARKAGIAQAVAELPNNGVTVKDGIEANALRVYKGARYGSVPFGAVCGGDCDVLHGVVPHVLPAYVLYSAWETTGAGRIELDIPQMASFLHSLDPSIKFGIGELGGFNQSTRPLEVWLFKEQLRAVRRVIARTSAPGSGMTPLSFAVLWKAFPNSNDGDELLSVEGAETDGMRTIFAAVQSPDGDPSFTIDPAMQINAVREISPSQSSPICSNDPSQNTSYPNFHLAPRLSSTFRDFELYPTVSFPGSQNYQALAKCSFQGFVNNNWDVVQIFPGVTQTNVRLSVPAGADAWCVFKLRNPTTQTESAEFGPFRSWANTSCNAVAI